MKVGIVLAILLAPAALLAQVSGEGRTAGKAGEKAKAEVTEKVEKKEVSKKTQKNLDKAMHGEALAYAKYMLYAEKARENGREDLARLYEDTARTEHEEHLKEEAKLAGTVGTDEENLKASIEGESYEAEKMYPEMAREARAAGDAEAADRFEELARDEKMHRDHFKKHLETVKSPPATSRLER